VEVRQAFGQALDEPAAFTAAYVAQMFIPDDAVDAVWRATARALAPGAWLTTGVIAIAGAELNPSITRFRSAMHVEGCGSSQDYLCATFDTGGGGSRVECERK